jgi:hypothetical protein
MANMARAPPPLLGVRAIAGLAARPHKRAEPRPANPTAPRASACPATAACKPCRSSRSSAVAAARGPPGANCRRYKYPRAELHVLRRSPSSAMYRNTIAAWGHRRPLLHTADGYLAVSPPPRWARLRVPLDLLPLFPHLTRTLASRVAGNDGH